MSTAVKTYPDDSVNGAADQTITTLNGLPSIPANAILDSVVLSFTCNRTGGRDDNEIRVRLGDTIHYYIQDLGSNDSRSQDITGIVRNNNGTLTYTDGSTSLNLYAYHTFKLFDNANWKLTNIKITANYTIVNTYVMYDSIFSFKRWVDTNLKSWSLMNISNVTDIGFTGTALAEDAYTEECRPLIYVEKGKQYIIEFDREKSGHELFVFHCDSNGAWSTFDYLGDNTVLKEFTAQTNYISIRVDIIGNGNTNTFSNFRIYPSGYGYMSASVPATERTDLNTWSMPTPTRAGYTFKGWNTKPDGSGTTYTSGSAFPTSSLVLYSQWERSGTYYVLFSGYGATSGTNSAPSAITATYGKNYTLPTTSSATFYKQVTVTWNGNADDTTLNYTEKKLTCSCIGWKKDPYSSVMYQQGESVNIEPTTEGGNVTFYATWGAASTKNPSATRPGYKFTGWNTKADGSGTAYTGDTVATSEDITLYAQWEKAEPVFTSITITRSTDLAKVTINTPVEAGAKYIISVEVT